MKVLSLSEAKRKLGAVLSGLEQNNEAVTITLRGKSVAVIMGENKYDGLQETLKILSDGEFAKEIREGIQRLRRTKRRFTIDELFGD